MHLQFWKCSIWVLHILLCKEYVIPTYRYVDGSSNVHEPSHTYISNTKRKLWVRGVLWFIWEFLLLLLEDLKKVIVIRHSFYQFQKIAHMNYFDNPVYSHNNKNKLFTKNKKSLNNLISSILVPVVMLSVCFNLPKFWEIDVVTRDANSTR